MPLRIKKEPHRIRYLDFQELAKINKDVVALTGEPHEYTLQDAEGLQSLLREVRNWQNNLEPKEALVQKASLLIYGIVKRQHFHEGNKRTALVAGTAFLRMNGYSIDVNDIDLIRTLNKVAISTASFNSIVDIVRRLIRNV